jgi:hypothetical protein
MTIVAIIALFATACTKKDNMLIITKRDNVPLKETIVKKADSYPAFCTSSCTNFVGVIQATTLTYSGTTGWGSVHMWISNPLPYDVVITFANRYNGYTYLTQWGNQVTIPAGQNNSAPISGYPETYMMCSGGLGVDYWDGNSSQTVSRTYSVDIVSIDKADFSGNLNSQYQLWPGSGNIELTTYCIAWQ